jgi:transposase
LSGETASPYSTDLRERVLRACEVGEESQAAIARRFEISESAVGSWLRQLRQDGRREPKPHGRGFPSILDEDDGAVLRSLVAEKNDAAEYAKAFTARTGEEISDSSMCRAPRLGC